MKYYMTLRMNTIFLPAMAWMDLPDQHWQNKSESKRIYSIQFHLHAVYLKHKMSAMAMGLGNQVALFNLKGLKNTPRTCFNLNPGKTVIRILTEFIPLRT